MFSVAPTGTSMPAPAPVTPFAEPPVSDTSTPLGMISATVAPSAAACALGRWRGELGKVKFQDEDVVAVNAPFPAEIVAEQRLEQIGLPRPPKPGNDLDLPIPLGINQFLKIFIPFDLHAIYIFCGLPPKL